MANISLILEHPVAQALAWALVHFLWQGAALGLLAFVLMRVGRPSATARYAIGVTTMVAMLVAPVVTFTFTRVAVPSGSPIAAPEAAAPRESAAGVRTAPPNGPIIRSPDDPIARSPADQITRSPDRPIARWQSLPLALVLSVWFAGVMALSVRLAGGWVVARRLTARAVRPVTAEVQMIAERVALSLGIWRLIRVLESSAVAVPVMVGWLKPIVLLPAAALAGLSPMQVEALLAHELAHVRRHDYLVNLLQSAVETILFYHPAVWWVSRQVRAEREHCCDDLAVGVCDRLTYVTALSSLAALAAPRVALAATDGSLINRVRRLLGSRETERAGGSWLAIVPLALVLAVVLPNTFATAAPQAGDLAVVLDEGQQTPPATAQKTVKAEPVKILVPKPQQTLSVNIKRTDAERQAIQEQLSQREEQLTREMRVREIQMAAQQEIEERRLKIQLQRVQLEAQAQMSALQAELAMLKSSYERSKRMVEVGTMNPQQLAEIEQQLVITEQRLAKVRGELELQTLELDLRREELKLQTEGQLSQYRLQQEEVRRAQASNQEARLEQERAQVADRLVARNLAGRALSVEVGPRELSRATTIAANARAGDSVQLEVAGESDLPARYVVQANGTMRIPFVGSITVLGLTAAQVQDAVAKLLTDKGLAKNPAVKAVIRRPR